eukprot:jgi/Hompol1/2437/HPOL_006000-RA
MHLSGGNRRKVSVAVAIIGRPPVILLDEPSTGMDVLSKRHMWDVITSLLQEHAVVLTTHSMEEAEAISSRLAIMSHGSLRCIGTMQHLRDRFSSGYEVDIVLANDQVNVESLGLNATQVIASPVDPQRVRLKISTPMSSSPYALGNQGQASLLAPLFDTCEALKSRGLITDYRVSATTLEQIFIDVIEEAEYDHNGVGSNSQREPESTGIYSWNNQYKGYKAVSINILWFTFGWGWISLLFGLIFSFVSIF